MRDVAIYDLVTGLVVGTLSAVIIHDPAPGYAYLDLADATDPRGMMVVDGALAPAPADLAALRAARWELVKAARDRAEGWGCETPAGRVDTDPDSQRKVLGADVAATKLGAAFAVPWTLQDNSVATLDAAAMGAVALAVFAHVAGCHAVADAKRAALDAAADEAAISAVDVDGGWPDAPAAG